MIGYSIMRSVSVSSLGVPLLASGARCDRDARVYRKHTAGYDLLAGYAAMRWTDSGCQGSLASYRHSGSCLLPLLFREACLRRDRLRHIIKNTAPKQRPDTNNKVQLKRSTKSLAINEFTSAGWARVLPAKAYGDF